jgi:hypothetical protein
MEIRMNFMKLIFLRNINRIEEGKNHIFFQQIKEKFIKENIILHYSIE